MGWSIGHDSRWGKFGRDVGYGVPATCDHPDCTAQINRGLSYVCGSEPYGGDHGCGLFFCGSHLRYEERGEDFPQLCERCAAGREHFEPKADTAEWSQWKLIDESWTAWRDLNPDQVAAMMADGEGQGSPRPPQSAEAGSGTSPSPNPLQHMEKGHG